MEVLWLLAVGFVPVLFAPQELMAFIDLPKVALLRTLTGLMALVWVAEWGRFDLQKTERVERHGLPGRGFGTGPGKTPPAGL